MAAIHAARMGARVAILEQEAAGWGGTCLNWGCIPTKSLIQGAEVLQAVRRAAELGIRVSEPEVDWPVMRGRKDWLIGGMRKGVQSLLQANGVEMITARGRLAGGTRVSADGRVLEARHVLLAPGSVVALPPIPGVELALTSDTILGIDRVPGSLIVIGGGVVGMEFASLFNLLGARVTVIELLDQVLTPLDPDVAAAFTHLLAKRGVDVHLGAQVEEIAADGELRRVRFSGGELFAAQVLVATGRRPNTGDLGLEAAGVATDRAAITVDQHLRTNQKHIYACGDLIGSHQFTHYAAWQAYLTVRDALLPGSSNGLRAQVPWTIFTDPEVARCGLTEQEARDRHGDQVRVATWPLERVDRAQAEEDRRGFIKVVHKRNGEVLGAHIMAARAARPELAPELRACVDKAARYYTTLGHGSFAPGNAEGGLTTQEEKSMGAYSSQRSESSLPPNSCVVVKR